MWNLINTNGERLVKCVEISVLEREGGGGIENPTQHLCKSPAGENSSMENMILKKRMGQLI